MCKSDDKQDMQMDNKGYFKVVRNENIDIISTSKKIVFLINVSHVINMNMNLRSFEKIEHCK